MSLKSLIFGSPLLVEKTVNIFNAKSWQRLTCTYLLHSIIVYIYAICLIYVILYIWQTFCDKQRCMFIPLSRKTFDDWNIFATLKHDFFYLYWIDNKIIGYLCLPHVSLWFKSGFMEIHIIQRYNHLCGKCHHSSFDVSPLWLLLYYFAAAIDTPVSTPLFVHIIVNIEDLVKDCSNSSALALELLQSCTKPSICCCPVTFYAY